MYTYNWDIVVVKEVDVDVDTEVDALVVVFGVLNVTPLFCFIGFDVPNNPLKNDSMEFTISLIESNVGLKDK
jgi:hypothetical protein